MRRIRVRHLALNELFEIYLPRIIKCSVPLHFVYFDSLYSINTRVLQISFYFLHIYIYTTKRYDSMILVSPNPSNKERTRAISQTRLGSTTRIRSINISKISYGIFNHTEDISYAIC